MIDLSGYLEIADIDDTPVNGELEAPISSNWAYDHENAADPHSGYLTPAEHTAIGDSSPHHAAVTIGAGSDPTLSLAGQELTLANVLTSAEADLLYEPLGVDAADVTFTPSVATDWDGDADPGDLDDALDQLAERVDDLEAAPPSHVHDAADVTYTPNVLTDWDSDADPGDTNDALDQLAERVDDVENAGYLTSVDAADVTYTPNTLTDWDSDADPGDTNDALDQLAERTDDLEATSHAAITLAADADVVLSLSTQEIGLDTQTANTVFAGPTSGGAADPTFRALVAADVPDISATYAVATKGVTNGDTHDHAGGDGAQIDHGGLAGLSDADHVAASVGFTATDKLLGRSTAGAGAGEEIACTAAGRDLLDDANAGAQRSTLGLGAIAVEDVPLAVAKGGDGVIAKPAFLANKGGVNQDAAKSTYVKLTFGTEVYDTNNNFVDSTFTPTIAGKYLLMGQVLVNAFPDASRILLFIIKNAATSYRIAFSASSYTTNVGALGAIILDANGSTDYFEVYIYHDGGSADPSVINGSASETWFAGTWISP